ncbi:M13 family peptidase [Vagococcus sp. BWB3-3]|uniref:M13 family peptidase n=1 Tax=Vagococcus allomyrinae TaxID=2794353 RepID=A0A940SUU5_9ENTE|nr:M13-type metalloendopeptidase [Vagococcus allomyrinae]MBP1041670.1 M13 family peptidase [Vagococcus allomyrinae]
MKAKDSSLTPQNDFYEYVNAKWLETAEIPADKPVTGCFKQLAEEVEQLLMTDFEGYLQNQEDHPEPELNHFINFYRLATDYKQRDLAGATPLLPYLAEIEQLTNLEQFSKLLPKWILESRPSPFSLTIDVDMKQTNQHLFFASAPQLFLPDKTYYDTSNESGKKLRNVFTDMMLQLLKFAGKTEEQARKIIKEAIEFDALLAPHSKSSEEEADILASYNPQTINEFAKNSSYLDFTKIVTDLVGETPTDLIMTDLAYFQAFDKIVVPENFSKLKSWMVIVETRRLSSYLSEEIRQTAGLFDQATSGSQQVTKQEKAAYYLACHYFDQIIGNYYARRYFGEEAKQDVLGMVEKMVSVYEKRLVANTWLNDATKNKAIIKLNKLGIQVGYPDKLPAVYKKFITIPAESGGTLLSNALRFEHIRQMDMFARYRKPVDRLEWEMSPDMVNAYYHPFKNIIVFPAAILQAPFYSLNQSSSANYGGIGAVIAHEISHAFDNNGASFDEYGNLSNWWLDEDLAYFKNLAQKMILQFDGLPIGSGTVNGTLTVSENIADAGGLSCALEAAKSEREVDLDQFFTNWATIWRMKASAEYTDLLLTIDVHAPNKLRANIQPQNLSEFYTTFNITEGDPMFTAPEQRLTIW